jgi:flagellin FlaB
MEKWIRTLRRFARNKKAISGLETAIVLIAFVIVASAFAYAVLNMGFLATQKSQEVVAGGLAAASSAVVVDGPVYGYSSEATTTPSGSSNARLTTIIFWLKTAAGADSVDLNVNKTTIGFQNPRGVWPNIYNTNGGELSYAVGTTTYKTNDALKVEWEVGSGYTLDRNEKVRVTIDLGKVTTDSDSYAGYVVKNEQFKIIVKPPTGSVLDIVRYAPPEVKTVNDLG